ncbi:Putative gypsy type transposon [Musa troglodytarum]|uniref:Gypsy type transposon n=1 Tax=Musa troglodytarum TaxID=320322 RepID=A0A9E7GAR3_9LILI|nr:Putative gypsy type transposon [Musa troglodytarum]
MEANGPSPPTSDLAQSTQSVRMNRADPTRQHSGYVFDTLLGLSLLSLPPRFVLSPSPPFSASLPICCRKTKRADSRAIKLGLCGRGVAWALWPRRSGFEAEALGLCGRGIAQVSRPRHGSAIVAERSGFCEAAHVASSPRALWNGVDHAEKYSGSRGPRYMLRRAGRAEKYVLRQVGRVEKYSGGRRPRYVLRQVGYAEKGDLASRRPPVPTWLVQAIENSKRRGRGACISPSSLPAPELPRVSFIYEGTSFDLPDMMWLAGRALALAGASLCIALVWLSSHFSLCASSVLGLAFPSLTPTSSPSFQMTSFSSSSASSSSGNVDRGVPLVALEALMWPHDLDSTVSGSSLIPKDYVLLAPEPGQRAYDPIPKGFVLTLDALEAGLRLPLYPVIVACISWWRISSSQVALNSWRYPVAFPGECYYANITPTRNLFLSCFRLSKGSGGYFLLARAGFRVNGAPSNNKGWKGHFFFVSCQKDWGFGVRWFARAIDNTAPDLSDQEHEDLGKLKGILPSSRAI